jgi:hypothetical protein
MSLTKETVIDKIEVFENGIVQVRQVIRIIENGTQLSQSYHRWALTPGQDLTGQPANVVAICNAAWTDEIVAAYQAQIESQTI